MEINIGAFLAVWYHQPPPPPGGGGGLPVEPLLLGLIAFLLLLNLIVALTRR